MLRQAMPDPKMIFTWPRVLTTGGVGPLSTRTHRSLSILTCAVSLTRLSVALTCEVLGIVLGAYYGIVGASSAVLCPIVTPICSTPPP